MGKCLVETDIRVELPPGTYGRIAPRSGIAVRCHVDIAAGVVDPDYTGNVRILVFNHSRDKFIIRRGDRIAQLLCEKIVCPELEYCETIEATVRGNRGFGSTGLR